MQIRFDGSAVKSGQIAFILEYLLMRHESYNVPRLSGHCFLQPIFSLLSGMAT